MGSFQGWDVAVGKAVKMYQYKDWAIAQGVELYKSDKFKIVKGNTWAVSYGFTSEWVMEDNVEATLDGTADIKACKNGIFDIYFNGETKLAKYVCVDEYTDLMVNITINNKANWSPLTITLKNGDIAIVENATVTGNKYAVSGDYIGETLSYTLSNGSKTMEGNVTISKTGAEIELEEVDVVTTIVYKNTQANQQTYWGNTTCLYVWGTGTALDCDAWPGNKMTKTADHTWSITIPSSLVGKTINYIINNGGDWKCADKTLLIKEGENVLTDQMLGIK